MPAVLVDVGYHLVEPDTTGQSVSLFVVSSSPNDPAVAGFDLKAQIVTAKAGPYFQGVRFAGDLWSTFPHIESGGPIGDRTLASGDVSFTQGFEARADGTLVTLTIDTTGIPAGSYEFRLVATQIGSSSFRRADGSSFSQVIKNGTLQVRSIWQNPNDPNDINDDGRITPLDALLLLNELSKRGSRELTMPSLGEAPFPFYDVNGDGYTSPKDALNVINCLNGAACVTTPAPILAKVTPELPDTTGTNVPAPANPKPETTPETKPADKVDPVSPDDCLDHGLGENETPILTTDPGVCVGSPPIPVNADGSQAAGVPATAEGDGAAMRTVPTEPSTLDFNFAATPAPESVDMVIADLVEEFSGESTSADLVELGLSSLFAAT